MRIGTARGRSQAAATAVRVAGAVGHTRARSVACVRTLVQGKSPHGSMRPSALVEKLFELIRTEVRAHVFNYPHEYVYMYIYVRDIMGVHIYIYP